MDYAGRRITVMGLGRFGGGVGVTKFLSSRGADVTVTDTASADELRDSIEQVKDLPGVSLVLGEHRERDFRDASLVVANPAVKPKNEFLQVAHNAGVPVTTEIVLLVRELPNRKRTIGVTGTAGKSTTTAMIAHILRKAFGREGDTPRRQDAKTLSEQPGVWMGGNLGGSLLPVVDQIHDDDWVVLELSSFMLHYLRGEKWSPHIAVVTNLSPNHLDWHGTFDEYAKAKREIAAYQRPGSELLIGFSSHGFHPQLGVELIESLDDVAPVALRVPGRHNVKNAWLAAHAASRVVGSPREAFLAVRDFVGLPHRLAHVAELDGVRFVNDSKSTTPEAARLALESFDPGTLHAILGGYDKGSDLSEVARFASRHCKAIYTIGETGKAIAQAAIAECGWDGVHFKSRDAKLNHWIAETTHVSIVKRCTTLDKALTAIREHVKPGEVVLLSPGCASWDQFENYEQRGRRFVELVRGGEH